jgi:hypothetical protein
LIDSNFFDEDVSQLEYELGRFSTRSDARARRPVAEALLSLRVGWLLATKERPEASAGFVSEIELAHFLEKTGAIAEHDERPVADLLGPAVGVPRKTAEGFCSWLAQWSGGEVARIRLPTVAEAQRPFDNWTPSPWLARLTPEAQAGTWCSDGFVSLQKLAAVERAGRWLALLLRFDTYFLFRSGILNLSGRRMPVRTDDLDFNVHYEKDRRYVENYAGSLVVARDALKSWDVNSGSRLGLAGALDFDPWENLRGMSPLDSQRTAIVEAYRAVRTEAFARSEESDPGVPTLSEMALEYFAPPEADRLAKACARQAERGVDRANLLPRLGALREAEARRQSLLTSDGFLPLQTALAQDRPSETEQWLALDAWYTTDMRQAYRAKEPWWRRISGTETLRPRDVLASIYADLAVLEERRSGRLQAFEGIRLVQDA